MLFILFLPLILGVLVGSWFIRFFERRNLFGPPANTDHPALASVIGLTRAFLVGTVIPTVIVAGLAFGIHFLALWVAEFFVTYTETITGWSVLITMILGLALVFGLTFAMLVRFIPKRQKASDQGMTASTMHSG